MIKLDGNAAVIIVVGVVCITLLELANILVLHHNGYALMTAIGAITGIIGGALGYKIRGVTPDKHLK